MVYVYNIFVVAYSETEALDANVPSVGLGEVRVGKRREKTEGKITVKDFFQQLFFPHYSLP